MCILFNSGCFVLHAVQGLVHAGGRADGLLRHGRPQQGDDLQGQPAGGGQPRAGARRGQMGQVLQMCVPSQHVVLRSVHLLWVSIHFKLLKYF